MIVNKIFIPKGIFLLSRRPERQAGLYQLFKLRWRRTRSGLDRETLEDGKQVSGQRRGIEPVR